MIATLRHYLSVSGCLVRMALQAQFEYPLFLVSWLLMIPIQYFSGIWMLQVLVERFHDLAGWTFPQLAFVYGLGLLSHGVMIVLAIQTWNIEFYVNEGAFDRMLLRPMNVFFQFLADYTNLIGLIDLIPGTIIFAVGCQLTGFAWTAENIFKLVLVVAGGVLIRTGFYTIICSIAFWTKRSYPMIQVGHDLLLRTTFYPLSIYPYALQMILTFALPLAFISFYPAVEFLGQSSRTVLPLGLALWTPVVGILVFAASQAVFRIGMRAYESVGS